MSTHHTRYLDMMNLLSIEEEASACRARCAAMQIGDICLHLHHEVFAEILTEPVENRISYILSDKPLPEQPLRLRMMGPPIIDDQVQADATWQKAEAAWQKAEAELQKASATRQKASATRQKASVDRQKSYVVWQKASADRQKASVDRQKSDAAYQKAYAAWQKDSAKRQKAEAAWLKSDAERQKAYFELQKASAAWLKAYEAHYKRLYPDSPWNGHTIFAGPFAELGSDS